MQPLHKTVVRLMTIVTVVTVMTKTTFFYQKKMFSPENFSFLTKKKLFTQIITQPLPSKIKQLLHTKSRNISTKKSCNLSTKISRNLQKNKSFNLSEQVRKIHTTPPQTKIMQPLHKQNHATSQKNIARIAKCCPENITLITKCVKLIFPKVLRKFLFYSSYSSDRMDNIEKKIMQPLHKKIMQLLSIIFAIAFACKAKPWP